MQPPHFLAVSSGEVEQDEDGTWLVPRAHVVLGGESLCVCHTIQAVVATAPDELLPDA